MKLRNEKSENKKQEIEYYEIEKRKLRNLKLRKKLRKFGRFGRHRYRFGRERDVVNIMLLIEN